MVIHLHLVLQWSKLSQNFNSLCICAKDTTTKTDAFYFYIRFDFNATLSRSFYTRALTRFDAMGRNFSQKTRKANQTHWKKRCRTILPINYVLQNAAPIGCGFSDSKIKNVELLIQTLLWFILFFVFERPSIKFRLFLRRLQSVSSQTRATTCLSFIFKGALKNWKGIQSSLCSVQQVCTSQSVMQISAVCLNRDKRL